MKKLRLLVGLLLAVSLTGCGVDKFFIERAVNDISSDVVEQLEAFATLNEQQQQHQRGTPISHAGIIPGISCWFQVRFICVL